MKIAWSIKIPKGAKLKVKDNSEVKEGDLIYEFNQNVVERLPVLGWQKLSTNDRKIILQNIIKKDLTVGDVFKVGTWLSPVTIKSPGSGKCMGIDEFGNIEFEISKFEKYLAPISAKKIRVEEDKIVFELKGSEFECEGVNDYKAWGDYGGLVVTDLSQIGFDHLGQVVVVDESVDAAIKAEAIGASGLILINIDSKKDFDECSIPVVMMTEDQLNKMIKFVDGKNVKIWLNATASKVIVVLE